MSQPTETQIAAPEKNVFEPLHTLPGKLARGLVFLIGVSLSTAMIPLVFPVSWMSYLHEWLGLGEFPETPITIYLARSTSLLYAMHGLMLIAVAIHLRGCWPLAEWIGWLHAAVGLSMLMVDLNASMPLYWTVGEGPPVAFGGLLLVGLCRRANRLAPRRTGAADRKSN